MRQAEIYFKDEKAGLLTQKDDGSFIYQYHDSWMSNDRKPPISLTLPKTKYYGVNIKNYTKGWLEYRYIGGTDYQFKTKEIIDLMDYFVLLTWNNLDKEMTEDDNELLLDYLTDNISNFKKFNDLEKLSH